MTVHFTIVGPPQGKGRPRFSRTRYGVKTFTPDRTVAYENLVSWTYSQECPNTVLEGNISATIHAYFPIPQSTPKRKREKMTLDDFYYFHKPDADNIAKIILDSLNNIAFHDDAQVVELKVKKFYSSYPRVEVWLEEVGHFGNAGKENYGKEI